LLVEINSNKERILSFARKFKEIKCSQNEAMNYEELASKSFIVTSLNNKVSKKSSIIKKLLTVITELAKEFDNTFNAFDLDLSFGEKLENIEELKQKIIAKIQESKHNLELGKYFIL